MEVIIVSGILVLFAAAFFGVPFFLYKGPYRVFTAMGLGCVLFILFTIAVLLVVEVFNLSSNEHPYVQLLMVALFVSLPTVLLINGIIAVLFYFIMFRKNRLQKLK